MDTLSVLGLSRHNIVDNLCNNYSHCNINVINQSQTKYTYSIATKLSPYLDTADIILIVL